MNVEETRVLKIGEEVVATADGMSRKVYYNKGDVATVTYREGTFFTVKLHKNNLETGVVDSSKWELKSLKVKKGKAK